VDVRRCLIDILIGFGCTVLCYDVYQNEAVKQKKNTKYVELDELLAQSDIISLHLPLLESTRHMINDKSIAKMKRGVMLINTSRGGLIETSALINGLKTGQIGYAGLDVYEEEEAYFFEDHSAEVSPHTPPHTPPHTD
jgi:D-lactate dehydrogenase